MLKRMPNRLGLSRTATNLLGRCSGFALVVLLGLLSNDVAADESDDFAEQLRQKVFSSAIHCPDLSDEYYASATSLSHGATGVISGQSIHDREERLRWTVQAGGDKVIEKCNWLPGLSGTIDDELLYRADIDMGGVSDLEFRITADCDTVLLVSDADGQWYFDDDGGEDSQNMLRIHDAPSGDYDIWVGTQDGEYCDATIVLKTYGNQLDRDEDVAGQASNETDNSGEQSVEPLYCPSASDEARKSAVSLTLESGALTGQFLHGKYDSSVWAVKAGGDKLIGSCDLRDASGYFDDELMILAEIVMRGDLDLAVQTRADCDTVLVVSAPGGRWFFDDDSGDLTQDRVYIPEAPGGEYKIWVGTLDREYCDASIELVTF